MNKYKHDSHFIEFSLVKKITRASPDTLKKIMELIDTVKTLSYDRVKIPEMSYQLLNSELIITTEYIKGTTLDPRVHTNFTSIIFEDLVLSENDYSATDYNPRNFVIQDNTYQLYYVDIYGITKENRNINFDRHFR